MSYNQKELKSVFNRIGGSLVLFLALYTALLSPASTLQQWLIDQFPSSVAVYVVTDLLCSICYAISFLSPVAFFYLISKKIPPQPMQLQLRLSRERTVLSTLAIVFWGTAVCLTGSYLNSVLFPLSDAAYDMLSSSIDTGYELVLIFISTAIVPAFVEELLFRGMVLSNLVPYNEAGAIIVSAVTFGLMHQTPYQILYTTAVGIVFGLVYVKTGSIWSGVLLHFFNNFFAVIRTYLFDVLGNKQGRILYNIMILSVIFLGFVFGAAFSIADEKAKIGRSEKIGIYGKIEIDRIEAKRKQTAPASFIRAFFSPTMIIFVVLCIVSIVSFAERCLTV